MSCWWGYQSSNTPKQMQVSLALVQTSEKNKCVSKITHLGDIRFMPQKECYDLLCNLICPLTHLATSDEVVHISIAMLLVKKKPWAYTCISLAGVPLSKSGFQNSTPDETTSVLHFSHNPYSTALVLYRRSEM